MKTPGFVQKLLTITNMWRPRKVGPDTWFYPLNNPNVWGDINYVESFNTVPELNAVINLKARAFANGRIKELDFKGREVEDSRVVELFESPNWFQGYGEFLRQTKLFREIFGNEYLYYFMPVGMPDKVKTLYTIPPNIVLPEYLSKEPFFNFGTDKPDLRYSILGGTTLDTEMLIHLNDNRVNIINANQRNLLLGESKMRGLGAAIVNIRMAYESRGVILKYRGGLGILSNATQDAAGAIPLTETEKQSIQDQYANYGGLEGQNQIIITNQNLKWQQMQVNPDKLGLFQETEEDFNKILDAYGVPSELLVRQKGATYENQNNARKNFYENTIMPEADEWLRGNKPRLDPLKKNERNTIIMCYDHLPIFQEDLKAKAEVLNKNVDSLSKLYADGAIVEAEYREELFKLGIGDGKPKLAEGEPPVDNKAQSESRNSYRGIQTVLSLQASVASGTSTRDSALMILTTMYGFTPEQANQLLGEPKAPAAPDPGTGGQNEGQQGNQPGNQQGQ